MVKRKTV